MTFFDYSRQYRYERANFQRIARYKSASVLPRAVLQRRRRYYLIYADIAILQC